MAECANGFEAVKAVAEVHPDLLLLDVQMPKLNGFEVLELVGREAAVVFTTAYDEYALRAFEVHAIDYLLKPFGPERLREAIATARQRLTQLTADISGDADGSRCAAPRRLDYPHGDQRRRERARRADGQG